ncbi:hypothetical protein SAMN05216459_1197 [Ensifer sp. OV372]|nr:hypothetical protein SAMN05216459_1197 [Ensifer sp. OV372]
MVRIFLLLTALAVPLVAIADDETDRAQAGGLQFRALKKRVRKAPAGEFGRKCDIPAVGWPGAERLWLPSVSQGAG